MKSDRSTAKTSDEPVDEILQQLENSKKEFEVTAGEEVVPLTNLDKILWPENTTHRPLTKRDLIRYLAECSPFLLKHMKARPLTLMRYPDGILGEHFFQRHWPYKLPRFVETVRIYTDDGGADRDFILCNNLATLIWLGQIADIELHTWFSRTDPTPDGSHLPRRYTGSKETVEKSLLNYPDYEVFDLDPYLYSGREKSGAEPELHKAGFAKTCEVALHVKEVVENLGLVPFIKTSGKTGLHVYVPLLRKYDFEVARAACETIGRFLMKAYPADITMEWSTAKRKGKVFFDHNMNARSKTIASVYSLRANADAGVSMPLRWEEVGKVYPSDFTILTVSGRLREVGDLWAGIMDAKRDLKPLASDEHAAAALPGE